MRRTITAVALLSALCISMLLPVNLAAASGVPQAVLDMRGSVVRVVCQVDEDSGFLGSGFAIGKDSVEYVVTNCHVVEENPNQITVLRGDNRQIAAKPYVSLPERDLCVLKLSVPQYDMRPFELFDGAPASVGEAVYTLGFPAAADVLSGTYTGEPGNVTVTSGIVSALKSWTIHESGTPVSIVQIDAAVNHGNSGGPLVNDKGQVLGVNTLGGMLDSQNINGAVSILELTDALVNNGIPFISASSSPDGNNSFSPFWIIGICLFAAAAIAVLLFVILRGKKKPGNKGKSASLSEYLRQWGGRLPYDAAIQVLEPALRELASMHAQGRYHADICPDNIFVAGNRACLRMPDGKAGSNRVVLRPGYSPPEQFRADGRIGPWSDVYSICAVIFYMVTGANPPGAVERQVSGGEGGFGFGSANIGDAQAVVVYSGLMLDAAKRPQNCVELLGSLGLPQNAPAPAAGVITAAGSVLTMAVCAKKRMGKRGKLIIAASAFLALCGVAAGFYIYEETYYNDAIACVSRQDYTRAIDDLTHVLVNYKSIDQWMGYACAGRDMQYRQFDSARAGFRSLGDFNDARTMIREVSYQEALYLIIQRDLTRAKEIFISLGDYKESPQMVFETDYQKALSQLQNKEFDNAETVFRELARYKYKDSEQMILEVKYQRATDQLQQKHLVTAIASFSELARIDYKDSKLMLKEANYQQAIFLVDNGNITLTYQKFKEMGLYKDSDRYLSIVTEKIYNYGISLYRRKYISYSKDYFSLITSYERSNDYIVLITAHSILDFPRASSKYQVMASYNAVKALGDFEDAVSVSNALKKLLSKK